MDLRESVGVQRSPSHKSVSKITLSVFLKKHVFPRGLSDEMKITKDKNKNPYRDR